jgi:hypothetical protein
MSLRSWLLVNHGPMCRVGPNLHDYQTRNTMQTVNITCILSSVLSRINVTASHDKAGTWITRWRKDFPSKMSGISNHSSHIYHHFTSADHTLDVFIPQKTNFCVQVNMTHQLPSSCQNGLVKMPYCYSPCFLNLILFMNLVPYKIPDSVPHDTIVSPNLKFCMGAMLVLLIT